MCLLCGRMILLRKESRLAYPSRLQPSCATHRICRRVLIPDQAVTPPSEGTSTPVKATCDERRPEQELRKSREELRIIHDNHCINDARASMDECINENYNPQCEVSAPGVTQTRDRVLRDKTKVAHHGTPPQKNKGACKPKDILATGTSDSPRASQADLAKFASA